MHVTMILYMESLRMIGLRYLDPCASKVIAVVDVNMPAIDRDKCTNAEILQAIEQAFVCISGALIRIGVLQK